MSLTRLALKFAVPAVKLEAYRRYLFIGPHPDDIEIGAGGTAAKLAAEGKDVAFLICTDGRYGDGATALRGDELAEERRREAIASAKMLGVTDVRFIGLSRFVELLGTSHHAGARQNQAVYSEVQMFHRFTAFVLDYLMIATSSSPKKRFGLRLYCSPGLTRDL